MQIKKGPYGYFAIEKYDDPDRLCTYAEEVIAGNRSDFYLKPSTEYIGSGIMCSFEFSGYLPVTDPEFSVLSPGRRSTSHKKELKNLNLRRRSAGDLFYTFIKLLDNLISPSCIVLDPDMVFTDPEGITIKLCCLPLKIDPAELCLSSLDASKLERLLNCDFFKSILTDDEINTLVFSVRENNEERFIKTAGLIRGTDGECTGMLPVQDTGEDNTRARMPFDLKAYSKEEKDLLVSCLSAFLSFASLVGKLLLPCFLFFFLSVVILIFSLLKQKKKEVHVHKEESKEKSKQRSSILFSENALTEVNTDSLGLRDHSGTKTQPEPLISGQLTLISDTKGINPHYSIYLNETNIGSDCFLSDIVLDDPEIAPLHAVIKQKNGTFYLEPAIGMGKTYLEDSPVENGSSYEIKTGQKITVGDIDFRFCVENMIGTEY